MSLCETQKSYSITLQLIDYPSRKNFHQVEPTQLSHCSACTTEKSPFPTHTHDEDRIYWRCVSALTVICTNNKILIAFLYYTRCTVKLCSVSVPVPSGAITVGSTAPPYVKYLSQFQSPLGR